MVINGTLGNDVLIGTNEPDTIRGFSGNDSISGRGGVDWMDGGTGWDVIDYSYSTGGWRIDIQLDQAESLSGTAVETILNFEHVNGSEGSDSIYGDTHANDIVGRNGNDYVNGRGGNDLILGGRGNDTLVGDSGMDRLYGEDGNDVLRGGSFGDTLVGGNGSDRFVFTSTGDSPGASSDVVIMDVIQGFQGAGLSIVLPGAPPGPSSQDVIDLSAIDAIVGSGNNAFTFLGERPLGSQVTPAGSLWVSEFAGDTMLFGNTDTNSTAEFAVRIVDGPIAASSYEVSEFLL